MDKKMLKALNEQINAELYSAYLYLSMSAWCESKNLKGAANWLRAQTQEEIVHAMKIHDHVNERSERVDLKAIDEPPKEWDSLLAAFEDAYAHEQKVTGLINGLVDLATEVKDHATYNFLQWFVAEQVEEEASTSEVVEKLKLVKDVPGALFMIDQELSTRVFVPPQAGVEAGG